TLVLRAVDAALLGVLDERVDDAGVAAVDVDPDASDVALGGQALRELRPRLSAVGRLPQRAAGAAAVVAEGGAPALVGGGVERVRTLGVHGHVHEAGVLVDELRVRPGLAAVGGAEQAALPIGSP